MGELNADRGVLALHEGDQRLEALRLRVVPDAKVMLVDEPDLLDRASLVFDLGVIEADARLLTLQKRFVNNMQAA